MNRPRRRSRSRSQERCRSRSPLSKYDELYGKNDPLARLVTNLYLIGIL